MKSSKITHKITQGMYVLTTPGGGCVVDAVARVGGSDQPLIAVAVAKQNHSNTLLQQNPKFALSVLGQGTDANLIQVFGFCSSRDSDKLAKVKTRMVADVPVIEETLGYMVLEKVDAIENETHTLFIGKIIADEVFDDADTPLSYANYREHKSQGTQPKATPVSKSAKSESADDLTPVKTAQDKTAWVCTACGYIYYGNEVPDDYRCPLCGLGKEFFKRQDA